MMRNNWKKWRIGGLFSLLILLILGWGMRHQLMPVVTPLLITMRCWQYGAQARGTLRPLCQQAGVKYPLAGVIMLALKQEREVQLYGLNETGTFRYLGSYPILGASGEAGPKLRQGDRQVPEGFYRIESLHPLSSHHLALRVNYPNEFDRAMAKGDGRDNLGGDIMIHGGNGSVGCLAMGDRNIRDLFVLANDCGLEHVSLIISPYDFLNEKGEYVSPTAPKWLPGLYERIAVALNDLPD